MGASAMPPLADEALFSCYKCALANWRFEGYVTYKEIAQTWLRQNFSAYTLRGISELLHDHVSGGGTIDQQRETRPEWAHYEFHYDLRVTIDGKLVYFETLLLYDDPDDPDDPRIHVVSVHYA